jgi:hypothetical protein
VGKEESSSRRAEGRHEDEEEDLCGVKKQSSGEGDRQSFITGCVSMGKPKA